MRVALFSILDDKFLIGFKVFMKSFLHFNPWFDFDFIILDLGLSRKVKAEMLNCYSKIVFRKPQYDKYKAVNFGATHDKLKATYYFLDAFCQYDYDKIVSIDAGDMVILGDMKEVFFNTSDGITGVKAYNRRKDNVVNDCNAGLFVVGKKYLNEKTYKDLISIAQRGFSMPEQKTMNLYFSGKWEYVNKKYNVEKRMKFTNRKHLKQVLINPTVIHFVGLKPWECHEICKPMEKQYADLEENWWRWFNRL